MSTDDSITIGERYTSATDSTNLKLTRLSDNRGCDADLLIAAGWLGERLGASLFRLMHEFDGVRGQHGIAQAEFDRAERAACALDKTKPAEAAAIRKSAAAQALTSRALILIHLKTLPEVRQAMGAFAKDIAVRRASNLPEATILKIAGQVLDVFIDKTCHACQGRGKNGGYGSPEIICRTCGGTGKRSHRDVGKDQEQADFGRLLLDQMERMIGQAAAGLKAFTRNEA